MGAPAIEGLAAWHRTVGDMTCASLDEILAEDVVFHSPVVHTPQVGRGLTKLYLMAAFNVMPGSSEGDGAAPASAPGPGEFRYVREVVGECDAVLEFMTEIDGITINGIDMIFPAVDHYFRNGRQLNISEETIRDYYNSRGNEIKYLNGIFLADFCTRHGFSVEVIQGAYLHYPFEDMSLFHGPGSHQKNRDEV